MPILGDFAVKYAKWAGELGVPTDDLYQALRDTAVNTVRLFHCCACNIFKTACHFAASGLVHRRSPEHRLDRIRIYPHKLDGPVRVDGVAYSGSLKSVRGMLCFLGDSYPNKLCLSQYALGDFAVRQAAIALGKSPADVATFAKRSMNFVNMWDPSVTSDGFSGFAQRRLAVRILSFVLPIFRS